MTLPTFFVVGAMKAGTTSLFYYLDQHPEIQMSAIKEPHFFCRAEDGPYPGRVTDRAAYERLFSDTARVRGEASPTYSLFPRHRDVPQRIAALVPEAKFIYMVRNPIDRVVSHYVHNVAEGGVRRNFTEAVGDLSDRENPYVYPCLYATQLEQYLEVFEAERILVVDQAQLLAHRTATLQEIFGFLEVDLEFYTPAFENEIGAGRDRRRVPLSYVRLARRAYRSRVSRWLPRQILRAGRGAVERVLVRPVPERPQIADRHRRQIAESCASEVARLREHCGAEFSTWDM